MNEVQKGTKRYKYPTVPTGKKVQIGTTPFRGVPFVPTPKQALDTDLLGHEIQIPKHTNDRPEAAALCEVLRALRAHPLVAWCERMNSGAARVGGRFIRFGFTGCPDVLGQLKDGRLLGVEVKAPKGKPSPEQSQFLARINAAGGCGFIAHDLRDVLRELGPLWPAARLAPMHHPIGGGVKSQMRFSPRPPCTPCLSKCLQKKVGAGQKSGALFSRNPLVIPFRQ